jgi:hypothetical protein
VGASGWSAAGSGQLSCRGCLGLMDYASQSMGNEMNLVFILKEKEKGKPGKF